MTPETTTAVTFNWGSLAILFLAALVATMIAMVATWQFAKRINNYSIVDAVWSFAFCFQVLIFEAFAEGWFWRKLVLASMVSLWSLRLGLFLTKRIRGHHPQEDSRYLTLRKEYEPNVELRFFWFFQMQAVSVSVLTIPFLLICLNSSRGFSWSEELGVAVWLISVLGEALADRQMAEFRARPENRGKVCNVGLWKYSRHPNYFFESCIWWGYFVYALASPGGVYTIFAPLIILFLLLKVTGVPLNEKQSLISRGDAYRQYQATTSEFVPWWPKRG